MLNESVMLGTFFDRSKTMSQFNINTSYDIKVNGVSVASDINEIIQGSSLYIRANHLVKFINAVAGDDAIVFIDNGNDNFAVIRDCGDLGKETVMVKVCRTVCFPEIETVDGIRAKQRDVQLDKEFSRERFEQLQECIAEIAFRTCPEIYGLLNVADIATNRFSISHFDIEPVFIKSEDVTVESGINPAWRIREGKSYAYEPAAQEQSVEVAPVQTEEEISFDLDGFTGCLPTCHPRSFYSLIADFVRPVELFRKKFKQTNNGVSHEQLGEMVAVGKAAVGEKLGVYVDPEEDKIVQIHIKPMDRLVDLTGFKRWIIDGMNA